MAFWNQTFRIVIHVISVSHLFPILLAKLVSTIYHDWINDLSSQSIYRLQLVFRIAMRTTIFLLAPAFIALLTSNSCFTVLAWQRFVGKLRTYYAHEHLSLLFEFLIKFYVLTEYLYVFLNAWFAFHVFTQRFFAVFKFMGYFNRICRR
jgi:hypothetical protein